MARPAKAVSTLSKKLSKEDAAAREAAEAKISTGEPPTPPDYLTDAQRELAEDEQALLERQLLRVQMLLDAGTPPVVAVTWFQPDAKKQGGAYVTAKGKVRKIDEFGGALLLVGGEKIPISAVIGIQLYNDKEQIEEG